MSYWREIVIILLVLWAVYHTFAEVQQDKRIDELSAKIEERVNKG